MTDASEAIGFEQPKAPAYEVLERVLGTCEKHGLDFERRLEQLPAKIVLGRQFRAPARWTGSCARCGEEARQANFEAARAEKARQAEQAMQERFGRAGVPMRLRGRSFDNYEALEPGQRHALTACREFAERFDEHLVLGSTLALAGKTGTGKGHLAAAVCMTAMRGGHTAFFATSREILLMLRASWSDKDAPSELDVLRHLVSVDLLVIDDIGVQFGTDAERDQLFSVIDGRYREQKPMILTTNLSAAKLQDLIGERSFSRLREDGQWIAFDWSDWRAQRRAREGGAA